MAGGGSVAPLGAGCSRAELEGRGSGGEGRVVAQSGEREVEEDMLDRSVRESKRVRDGFFDREKSSAQSEIAKELVVPGQNIVAKIHLAAR